jgi:preprotein translocase subunit SecD
MYRTIPILMLLFVTACNRPAISPGHAFSLRLGSETPVNGMVEKELMDAGHTIFVAQQDIVSAKDVSEVEMIKDSETGRPLIAISVDRRTGDRLHSITTGNVGKLCVILIDNKAVTALPINAPLGPRLVIEGDFSGREVTEVISLFTGY